MALMTTRECASFLNIAYGTLLRLKREESENCPPYVMIGKNARFDEDEVRQWLKDHSTTAR